MFMRTFLLSLLLCSTAVFAADSISLVIKDHRFVPAELKVPANTKLKLIVPFHIPCTAMSILPYSSVRRLF